MIPFEYAGVVSENEIRGLGSLSSSTIEVDGREGYEKALKIQGILLDSAERRAVIRQQIDALAAEVDGQIPDDDALLAEVSNLVEAPTAFRGEFDRDFLALPRDVLVTVMRKHQRYFAVEDNRGELLPYFIAVRNGDSEHLRQGDSRQRAGAARPISRTPAFSSRRISRSLCENT